MRRHPHIHDMDDFSLMEGVVVLIAVCIAFFGIIQGWYNRPDIALPSVGAPGLTSYLDNCVDTCPGMAVPPR